MTDAQNDRLSSWKEIAAYLVIETRSAMRWENERGLPVHRVPGGKRNAVFAFRAEIDAWMAGRPSLSAEIPEQAPADPSSRKLHPYAWAGIGAGVTLLLVLAIFAGADHVGGSGPRTPERFEFLGEKLVAADASGTPLWEHTFPGLRTKPLGGSWRWGADRIRKVDLDGDGAVEILAVSHLTENPENSNSVVFAELHCFAADGRLRWSFRPHYRLQFGNSEFTAPWVIYDFAFGRDARGPAIWLLVNHHLWWPAMVVRLDAQGRDAVQFISSGQFSSLAPFEVEGQQRLLVGGYNNEYRAGTLTVLDPAAPPSISPQSNGLEFQCSGATCQSGAPLQYFVFPRSELNRVADFPTYAVSDIRVVDHQIHVDTYEAGEFPGSQRAIYTFSRTPELALLDQKFDDGYWQMHRRLEREGKISHSDAACPARSRPTPVRVWSPTSAWQALRLPASTPRRPVTK